MITGTATANTNITVRKDGLPICTTVTSSLGIWSCQSLVPFTEGTYGLTVVSVLGSSSKESASVSCVIISLVPIFTHPVTLNPIADLTTSCTGSTVSGIFLTGIGTPGAVIKVMTQSGVEVVSSVVAENGAWWETSTYGFTPGTYTLTPISTFSGATATGLSQTFTVLPATNCISSHNPPSLSPISNINLSCSQTGTTVSLL